jgi:hypothetical protein
MPASHAGDHQPSLFELRLAGQSQEEAGLPAEAQVRRRVRDANFTSPSKHCQRCIRSVSESARCNSG